MRHRIHTRGAREAISEAFRIVDRFSNAIGPVEFVVGVDPVFAGLHSFDDTADDLADDRSFRNVSHCCYPWNIDGPADRRCTTIVLAPGEYNMSVPTIVHELGHALHCQMGFSHAPEPVTDYAETNRYEAFAEAFTTYLFYGYGDEDVLNGDHSTLRLFEGLAA